MFVNVDLQGLAKIADGSVEVAFNNHVQRAIVDCEDRPGDKKPRKVTLEIGIVPVVLQDGATTDVTIEAKVKSSVPDHVSRPVECRVRAGGRAIFNDLSMDDPSQMTIDQ